MRTYTHGLIGYLLYSRGTTSERRLAAMGAMAPDGLLALGFVFHVAEPWAGSDTVAALHALFHHSPLHEVTVVLHSFVTILVLFAVSAVVRPLVPFVVGMLSHGLIDLLTHQRSAYDHFYPFGDGPMRGPFDYTSPMFSGVEHVSFAGVLLWLWYRSRRARTPAR